MVKKDKKSMAYSSLQPEWKLIHLSEFCAEEDELCDHRIMMDGLEDAFNAVFDVVGNSKRNDSKKVCYGADKSKHGCILCGTHITCMDHPIGVYPRFSKEAWTAAFRGTRKTKTRPRTKKVLVMHDTCLSKVSLKKEQVLPSMVRSLKKPEYVQFVARWCVLHGGSECGLCEKERDDRVVNCADRFCKRSFHLPCLLNQPKKIYKVDYHEQVVYCKEHSHVMSNPNDPEQRVPLVSHSLITEDECSGCKKGVRRWPIRDLIVYVTCCGSFLHHHCVTSRLSSSLFRCPSCDDLHRYIGCVKGQGISMLPYRAEMDRLGVRPLRWDCMRVYTDNGQESEESSEEEEEKEEEEVEKEEKKEEGEKRDEMEVTVRRVEKIVLDCEQDVKLEMVLQCIGEEEIPKENEPVRKKRRTEGKRDSRPFFIREKGPLIITID